MKKLFPLLLLICLFTLKSNAQVPTIASFSPASGAVGTTVTITGTNFNATPSKNIVFFGATVATVNAATATSLTVTVPAGATYQNISLLNTDNNLSAYSTKPFTITFTPNKGSIATNDLAPKVNFGAGSNPRDIAIGDLDGDGKPDLVVTNTNSNTVSVFRNISVNGSITASSFAPKVDFAVGSAPFSIVIGDLDGDGKLDLAIGNLGGNSVSVLLNTSTNVGSISFATKKDFAAGSRSIGIAIGDLDGDGKLDLATANQNSNNVSILHNTSVNGSVSFAPKVDFATGCLPYGVKIGDLDGDGKPDLVVTNNLSSTVSVFRNISVNGSITASSFAPKVDFAVGSDPFSIVIGDLDGDGKPDLAVTNAGNKLSILHNTSSNGSITFAPKVDFTTSYTAYTLAIGDIDGDGKPDLAVTNLDVNTVSVFRNTSSSGAITSSSFAAHVEYATENVPYSLAIGDLDGDGKPDLVVANYLHNSISILRNNPQYPPTIASFSPASGAVGTTVTITGTNFNATPSKNIVFFGATVATVSAATATSLTVTVPAGATYQNISVLNTDNNLSAYSTKPFAITFTPNKGSIATNDLAPKVNFGAGSNPSDIAIGDLDGDGKPDLIVTNNNSNTVSVFRNISVNGSITASSFAPKVDFAVGSGPFSIAIGDLDGDGKLDLATGNLEDDNVSVLLNTSTNVGSISFATNKDFAAGFGLIGIAIGDLDGDGRPDLVTANKYTNSVSILHNTSVNGSVSFANKVDFATESAPYGLKIGDLDSDGKPDLVVTNNNSNTVSVFRNISVNGSITASSFAPKVDFAIGYRSFSIVIGDLDGDGKADLAVTNAGNKLSILHNTIKWVHYLCT